MNCSWTSLQVIQWCFAKDYIRHKVFAFESLRGLVARWRPLFTISSTTHYLQWSSVTAGLAPGFSVFSTTHIYRDVTGGSAPGIEAVAGCSLWKVFEPEEREIESEALSILKFLLLNYSSTAHPVSGCKTVQLRLYVMKLELRFSLV